MSTATDNRCPERELIHNDEALVKVVSCLSGRPDEDTSTVCSPSTPAVILKRETTQSSDKTGICGTEASHAINGISSNVRNLTPSMLREVERILSFLWNRDDMSMSRIKTPFTPAYLCVRKRAWKYITTYITQSKIRPNDNVWPIILAGIFLSFKSADYIPGTGRVRMNQLLEAFNHSGSHESITNNSFIQSICQIEMKMMCQCSFRFDDD
jgi:hypothetical protein